MNGDRGSVSMVATDVVEERREEETMAFTLTDTVRRRMCEIDSFPVPSDGMILLGFRGCLATNPDDQEFRTEHLLEFAQFDHVHPRCTICKWMLATGAVARFTGST